MGRTRRRPAAELRVPDEKRRDDELELIGEAGREELRQDPPAPLDHQPPYAPLVQILADPAHLELSTASMTVATAASLPGLRHRMLGQ